MPAAYTILYVMAGFIGCWSLSLVLRGLFAGRDRSRRQCPACGEAFPTNSAESPSESEKPADDGMRCGSCGYLAEHESELFKRRRCWPMIIAGSILLLLATPGLVVCAEVTKWWADPFGTVSQPGWNAAGIGVAFFGTFLGVWAYRGDRSKGRRRCPKCWYDMRGLSVPRCPECGWEIPHERHLYRSRRQKRLVAVAAVIVLAGLNLRLIPQVRQGGYVGAVPTTVLIALFEHLPDQFVRSPTGRIRHDMSLHSRLYGDRMWHWQERWLLTRVRRVVMSDPGADMLAKATWVYCNDSIHDDSEFLNHLFRGALRCVTDPSPRVRARAADIYFYTMNESLDEESQRALSKATPDLIDAIVDGQGAFNVSAISIVSHCGTEAEPAIPLLKRALESNSRWTTGIAAWSLSQLSKSLDSAKQTLLDALESQFPMVRERTGEILRKRHWSDKQVRTHMLALLQHGDQAVVNTTLVSLCLLPDDGELIVPAIHESVRAGKAEPLIFLDNIGVFRDTAAPCVPDVITFLDDPDPATRFAAAKCLRNMACDTHIDLTAAVPALQRMDKKDEVEENRYMASDALAAIED
jgi:HEAT repeat protein